eukprot:CAMPEP_0201475666 /NCGR_PEP_ID=MMETSP0151_2-20130828/1044_1 /ASSEMBLY_ACC=CAM_ASM_000257 /TAXON_ID=200890 /ORGANISM="Paramoeba atlantica, Strain 621/1 / CCAP 1560/9" /LENGTH=333 /DNA_ID=CAMNT_0047855817 /DNA_START=54 /DNA_END=1055 /DNA_ORIENTATION=-
MVRIGTLPFRLLAKKYGADACFVEELIDRSISSCDRFVNEDLDSVDFVRKGKVIFRTCAEDRPNIFQMGTADPIHALRAAEAICGDVDAIDVNMGCPKHFSISGGMGAALLKKPQIVKDIVSTLVRNINLPISCKIRVLPEPGKTLELAKIIEMAGASAITVHGRRQEERPRHPVRYDEIKEVVESGLSIPIVHNGDIFEYADIQKTRERTGVSSVMIARGAMWDASIFQPESLPKREVMREYVKIAIEWDNLFPNTKYVVTRMLKDHEEEAMNIIRKCNNVRAISEYLDLVDFYDEHQRKVRQKKDRGNINLGKREEEGEEEEGKKKAKVED